MADKEIGLKIAFIGFLVTAVGFGIVWFNMRTFGVIIMVLGFVVALLGIGKHWYQMFNMNK